MSTNYTFSAKKGTFCLLSNLTTYLSAHQLNCTESWLGGLLGYMGFYYTPLPLPSKEVIHGRNRSFRMLFSHMNRHLKNPLKCEELPWDQSLEHAMESILEVDSTPIIWINDLCLEYSPYYSLDSFWSPVIFINAKNENVNIFDNEVRALDLDTFKKAVRNGSKFSISFSPVKSLEWSESELSLLIKGLRTTAAELSPGHEEGSEYFGIMGMYKFVQDLSLCEDRSAIYNFFFQMNRPGGLSITRETMSKFFIEMGEQWPIMEIKNCENIYNALSVHWKKISNLLYKLSTSFDRDLRNRIVDRVFKAIDLEKEGIDSLSRLAYQMERSYSHEAIGSCK